MQICPSQMAFACLLPIFAILQACNPATEGLERHEEPIRNALQTQASQWNQGDIPAFMENYVKGDALRFSSAGTVQQGWEATLQRYLTRYPSKAAMGRLEFEELKIIVLSEEWAEVHGRYRLYRDGEYGDANGLFTLLMENTSDGWKILHDHTSADNG